MGTRAIMNGEQALERLFSTTAMLAGLFLSACGPSTVFASSWRAPKAEPLAMRGEKVAAVVMSSNMSMRRNAEDVLAREITHYGAKGVAMYTLWAGEPVGHEKEARAAVEAAGVKGVVVMRPMGTKTRTETHTSTWSDPMYSGYYGGYWGGYYGYGWGNVWAYPGSSRGALVAGPPVVYGNVGGPTTETYTTTETVFQVEVMVYSLKQNILVWAGMSETSDPDTKVDDFVTQLTGATVRELGGQGLLSSK